MGASRTWHLPVRGRFSFKPNERQKSRGGGYIQRPMIKADPEQKPKEQRIDRDSCYYCGQPGFRHVRGCPKWRG